MSFAGSRVIWDNLAGEIIFPGAIPRHPIRSGLSRAPSDDLVTMQWSKRVLFFATSVAVASSLDVCNASQASSGLCATGSPEEHFAFVQRHAVQVVAPSIPSEQSTSQTTLETLRRKLLKLSQSKIKCGPCGSSSDFCFKDLWLRTYAAWLNNEKRRFVCIDYKYILLSPLFSFFFDVVVVYEVST